MPPHLFTVVIKKHLHLAQKKAITLGTHTLSCLTSIIMRNVKLKGKTTGAPTSNKIANIHRLNEIYEQLFIWAGQYTPHAEK